MVSHNQWDSTNPWIGWACSLTLPNPEYGQSQPTELHQPMDWLNAQPKNGLNGVLLVVTDHIRDRLG